MAARLDKEIGQALKSERNIYTQEAYQRAVRAFEKAKSHFKLHDGVKLELRRGFAYKIARIIENNINTITDEDIEQIFVESIKRLSEIINLINKGPTPSERAEIAKRAVTTPSEEKTIIEEAVTIVHNYCKKHSLPFVDFSDRVRFGTFADQDSRKNKLSGFTYAFMNFILIDNSQTPEEQLLYLLHEAFHSISEGFPIDWLDEGVTEYMAVDSLYCRGNSAGGVI